MDTRIGRPLVFAGDEKWEEWYFKYWAEAVCSGAAHAQPVTVVDGRGGTTTEPKDFSAGHRDVARYLYLMLVMLAEGNARALVESVPDNNGAEALRPLLQRYSPVTQGQVLAKLNEVMQVVLGEDERGYMDRVVT